MYYYNEWLPIKDNARTFIQAEKDTELLCLHVTSYGAYFSDWIAFLHAHEHVGT